MFSCINVNDFLKVFFMIIYAYLTLTVQRAGSEWLLIQILIYQNNY